jgi:DNA-binding LacI/PurR family transcriptional regulator
MSDFNILTPSEQVAEYLHEELLKGRWSGTMPGAPALAKELGIDPKSVGLALNHLEKKGLLVGQGAGRPRKIVLPKNHISQSFRVAILDFDDLPREPRLTQDLEQAPYTIVTSPKTLSSLKMDLRRIKRHVKAVNADAWIVYGGSREVLEWFSRQPLPTFAMFGFMSQLPIAGAGPDSTSGFIESVHRLVALGHQRIVMLTPTHTRLPEPIKAVGAFLDTLEAEGLPTGPYNLPDWDEENEQAFITMLDSLFQTTPPTVIIINDRVTFCGVLQFLLERGIRVPEDVSLICHEFIDSFIWCDQAISYIDWDWAPISRRLRNWMRNVSQGKEDTRQNLVKSSFTAGRTLGPPA